ncbi:MAG TPA: hypothetical protein VL225_20880 [Vicinamibacterales bacterium]|nr:hypothetical protein [Vicinamibacterales bacterium]
MITRRTAGYGTLGAILVACLAAANMPSQEPGRAREPRERRAAAPAGSDAIAAEVRSQAARLHVRMSQAPVPDANPRNPFAFVAAPRPSRPEAGTVRATVVEEPSAPVPPPPPPLILMGIAEDPSPAGPRRTAVIALRQAQGDPELSRGIGQGDDILIVTEGQLMLGRYKVTKIGADAVELEDVTTHGFRRLALR